MKRITKISILFFLFTLTFACKKEEIAPQPPTGGFDFSALNSDLRAPAEINFTASDDIQGATYAWDFGDGSSSTEKTPKKVFTTGGSKLVKLTVTANGTSKSETKTIAIDKPYTKLRITKSTILSAATAYPNGTGWDIASSGGDYLQAGADVYLIAKFQTSTSESYYTNIKTNVTATQLTSGNLFWEHTAPGFLISSAVASAAKLTFELRDADVNGNFWSSAHEDMGYSELLISDMIKIDNKYPTSIELKGFSSSSLSASQKYLNDALKIKLDLKWEE
jgi:PKD repeat protein